MELVSTDNKSLIRRETEYIAVWEVIFSAAMQAVFLVIGRWDYRVLLGNLLSGSAAVLNFYLMSVTVAKTLEKEREDEKEARSFAKMSQTMRSFMLFCVGVLGVTLPCFNVVSALLPLIFPRIAAWLRVMFMKDAPADTAEDGERGETLDE